MLSYQWFILSYFITLPIVNYSLYIFFTTQNLTLYIAQAITVGSAGYFSSSYINTDTLHNIHENDKTEKTSPWHKSPSQESKPNTKANETQKTQPNERQTPISNQQKIITNKDTVLNKIIRHNAYVFKWAHITAQH